MPCRMEKGETEAGSKRDIEGRGREKELWGERLSIFFCPQATKAPQHRRGGRGVVRGTETDNVKAHTVNRPVTPRSYVT